MSRHCRTVVRVLPFFFVFACANRPTTPLVLTEQVGELPVQFSTQACAIPVLTTLPSQPHEVIARIKTYGNPGMEQNAMQDALHKEACALGAQAVVIQPLKEGQFEDSVSVTHLGYSTDRDYTSRADYAYMIVGLAIHYK